MRVSQDCLTAVVNANQRVAVRKAGGLMVALMMNVLWWSGIGLVAWLALESVLFRLLPRLERLVPSDLIGPDGWFCDPTTERGIFDLPLKRRRG